MAKFNPYQAVTDRILDLLDRGEVAWRKPWSVRNRPRNLVSGKAYRGINILLLLSAAYASPYWVTFRQAKKLGGHVRKGEKSTPVVFWKWLEKSVEDPETGEESEQRFPVLRIYNVFSVSQCDGLEDKIPSGDEVEEVEPIGDAEELVELYTDAPPIDRNRSKAFYRPAQNGFPELVGVPPLEAFVSPAEFYGALYHELVHSTGSPDRLKRFGKNPDDGVFGSESYSKEELVAEIGATFLLSEVGLEAGAIENSAAYIAGWRKKLSDDPKLIVYAAAQAHKAADLICGRLEAEKAA